MTNSDIFWTVFQLIALIWSTIYSIRIVSNYDEYDEDLVGLCISWLLFEMFILIYWWCIDGLDKFNHFIDSL